jgi:hypothetical protein
MQMGMARYKLGERVHHSDDRLAKLLAFHACGNPKGTCASHSATFCADSTSQRMFHFVFSFSSYSVLVPLPSRMSFLHFAKLRSFHQLTNSFKRKKKEA